MVYLAATKSAQASDVTPFNAAGECPDKVNKHECMFLPSTNCTPPEDLLPFLGQRKGDTLLFSKAAPDGKWLGEKRYSEYEKSDFKDLPDFKVDDYTKTNTYEMIQLNRSYTYINTGHALTVETGPLLEFHHESDPFGSRKVYFSYAMRLRSEFQLRVQYLVDTFRATNHYYANQTCVMHHMRKDDRQEKGADMIDWCKQRSYYDAVRKHLVTSGAGLNYGCQLVLPYGAASLEHYLNASSIMFPNIKNIFIATDDQAWLHQALEEYASRENNVVKTRQLRLLPFHPRHGHRQSSSLDVNAEFFATIELGRQCEGFVGYLQASAAADLFFGALCYRHHNHYLKCPNAFDFGSTAFP